jgi:photosystem II stability/assembly factor-like uncharacterized protein
MNDQQVEQRLREELRSRLGQGDPSDRLFKHVAHLGDETAEPAGATTSTPTAVPGRIRPFSRRSSAIRGLAAAACIVAVLAAALFWMPTAGPSPAASPPGSSESIGSPPPEVRWDGTTVTVSSFDRMAPNLAWVVGSTDGQTDALYVSTDDGSTWDKRPVPYGLDGHSSGPQFLDADHVFMPVAVGSNDKTVSVMRSGSGGRTWTKSVILENQGFDVADFQMIDQQHGWISLVDSRPVWWLWATTDGGVTWKPLVDTANQSTAPAYSIHFVSDQEGWGFPRKSVSNGLEQLQHTLDGGMTWTTVSLPLPSGYADPYLTLDWPQGSGQDLTLRGRLAGYADASTPAPPTVEVTWTSSDAGLHWRVAGVAAAPANNPPYLGSDVQGTYQASTLVSLTLPTPDGHRATFSASGLYGLVATGYELSLRSAQAFSDTEAWVTMDDCSRGDLSGGGLFGPPPCVRLLATSDGGKTWRTLLWTFSNTPQATPTAPAVPPCCTMNPVGERQAPREPLIGWVDPSHGWVVMGTSLYWTSDGGKTWDSGSPLPASGTIQFPDALHGWLISTGSSDPSDEFQKMPVYRTADGGRTWTETEIPWSSSDIPDVPDAAATWGGSNWVWGHFADATHGVVVRCPHLIAGQIEATCQSYTTDDGGATFHGPVTKTYATTINWLSATMGYAIGDMHTPVLHVTTDGGRTWTTQNLGPVAGSTSWFAPMTLTPKPGGGWRLLLWYSTQDGSTVLGRYETSGSGLDGPWQLAWQGPGPSDYLQAVRIAGGNLIGVSGTHFWSSSDFGQTWTQLAAASPEEVHDFDFTDSNTGWLVRAPVYASSPDAVLQTTDGGKTWKVVLQVPSAITNP